MTSSSPTQPEAIVVPPAKASGKRVLQLGLQALVSAALLVALAWLAVRYEVWKNLRAIDPADVVLAGVVLLAACVINSLRWKLLLSNAGISRPLRDLAGLYLIGLFFSMFLPTGNGGDVVRVYDVARKSGKLAGAVVATLQERLLGLGVSMLIGLGASTYYFDQLPAALRPWVLSAQIAGPIGVAVLLYPMGFIRPFAALWRRAPRRLAEHGIVRRIVAALASLASVPPLPPLRLLVVVLVSAAGIVLGISMFPLLGRSLEVDVSLGGFLLIVPLVWIVKLVPVSLGGLGVGELTIVFLLREVFATPPAPATALAFAFLALQICVALLGGALLAARLMRLRGAPAPAPASVAEGS